MKEIIKDGIKLVVKDGFKFYHFDTLEEYLKKYDSLKRSLSHRVRLHGVEVLDVVKSVGGQERYFFRLLSKDKKNLEGYAQINVSSNGGWLSTSPWETYCQSDVVRAKKGDIVTIGCYPYELKLKEIILRYFVKEK